MLTKPPSIITSLSHLQRVSEAEIDLEKCRLLFQNTGQSQAVVALNGTMLVFLLGGLHPPLWALVWVLGVYTVSLLRYRLSRRFLAATIAPEDVPFWRQRATTLARTAGVLWAAGGTGLMLADPETIRIFTALVLAGTVSGAVPILSPVPKAFRDFAVMLMSSVILTAALDAHGARDWMLAVVSALYLFVLLRSARYFHATLDSSIRLALNMHHMAQDVEQARRDAEASSNAKSQFLAMMSHEIRTPLNGILGMAQALLKPELGNTQRSDYTHTILNSGQVLLMLLNDILDFSKADAGKLELNLAECDLHRVVTDTAALFAESARRKHLSIATHCTSDPAAIYLADATRLRQMLSNLVSNAVKFTATGFVRVEAHEISRSGDQAVLELAVADSGIGIPLDRQGALFQPFVQVDNSDTREFGGTGLGLSIVRLLAELMGGEVGVDSVPGKGSRFWFRVRAEILPSKSRAAAAQTTPAIPMDAPDAEAPGGVRRVLVVEDNAVNRKVVGAMLARPGLAIEYVENGKLGLEAVMRDGPFDLILMDCQMPVMDGYTATRAIRDWESANGCPPAPIVALTAGAFDEDRERCLAAGMDDFLTKPVNLAELHAMLEKRLDLVACESP
ncbi:MAG: ATP-binding protein [Ignavibacteria bacterium]